MERRLGDRLISRFRQLALGIIVLAISISCSDSVKLNLDPQNPVSKSELNVWWEQGYNLEEDEAIRNIVADWQSETGDRVKLSFFSTNELIPKVKRAVEVGNPPDLMISPKADRILYPQLAWANKLEDVSDIIEPVKDDYPKNILKAISYINSSQGKRSYHAVPIDQFTIFIFYWQDLLASVGLNARDIPQDWNGFWQFWQQAQTELKTKRNADIYALGFPLAENMSTTDTYYLFDQILEAYDVSLFDSRGKLQIEHPQVRRGIIQCLDWYARLYQQGYIPPDAVQWTNTSNNSYLLNRQVLMTANSTFSIPATVNRDEEMYFNRLGIVEFPHKPSGATMNYLISIRQAVIFQDSPHKSIAKDFLSYFIQPHIAIKYLKASGNRTKPVRASVWSDSFWQETTDPYLTTATKILNSNSTRLFSTVTHPAYSQVLAENIWGKALTRVTAERVQSQQAAEEAIARIKAIFAEWDRNN